MSVERCKKCFAQFDAIDEDGPAGYLCPYCNKQKKERFKVFDETMKIIFKEVKHKRKNKNERTSK